MILLRPILPICLYICYSTRGVIISPNPRLVTWYQSRLGLGFTSKPTLIQFFVAVAPSLCCPRGQLLPLLRLLSQSFHSRPPSRPRVPFPGRRRGLLAAASSRIHRPCASAVQIRAHPRRRPAHSAVRRIRPLPSRHPPDPPSAAPRRPAAVRRIRRLSAAPGPPAVPAPIADLRRSARRSCARPALRKIRRPGSAQIRLLSNPAASAVPLSLVTIAVTSSCGQGCRSAPLLSLRRWLPLRAELRWP
jgi:hypothetical protein